MRQIVMRLTMPSLWALIAMSAACHRAKPPVVVTQADVDAAQQEARHEVEQARVEAKKDVKSVVKIMGADSPDVARARVTGSFDVAMAHADGDHKIALEKCLLLDSQAQPACKSQADAEYQTAAANAKEARVLQQAHP